jgi:hypothetical protein
MMLTTTQQAEIMLRAAEDGRLFVQEWHEILDPACTDWDGIAWQDAKDTLPWIGVLLPAQSQEAWQLYQDTLVAETVRLVDATWCVFVGAETRQVDGVTGQPAEAAAWYAEPLGYDGDTLYSPACATRAAAEAWAARQSEIEDDEEDTDPGTHTPHRRGQEDGKDTR